MNLVPSILGSARGRSSLLAIVVAAASSLAFLSPAQAAGFEGYYAPSNWTVTELGDANGSVDTSSAPGSITLIGSDDGSGDFSDTYYTITAAAAGTVSFNWLYNSEDDPGFDSGFYVVTSLGNYILLSDTDGESGTISFAVSAGQLFGFNIYSEDSTFGAGYLTISNFSAPTAAVPAIPEPSTYALMALGLLGLGAVVRRRRKA